jgi:hypothetical protein
MDQALANFDKYLREELCNKSDLAIKVGVIGSFIL